MRLVLRSLWDGLRKKFNGGNGVFERPQRNHIHSQMGNDHVVLSHLSLNGQETHGRESHVGNSVVVPVGRHGIAEDNWGNRVGQGRHAAGNAGNLLDGDWRRFVGFIGHDGFPYLWDEKREAWTRR
jgi:hypothetical protein